MSYIPNEIKESWKEIAQALLDSDGGLGNKCKLYFQNEIIKINPGEITDFRAITDVITLVVKIPGANNDKYE